MLGNHDNSQNDSQCAKWICSTCTYENWSASRKCAMCETSHSSPQDSYNENEDLYKLVEAMSTHSLNETETRAVQKEWCCDVCLYRNRPSVRKCAVCCQLKSRDADSNSGTLKRRNGSGTAKWTCSVCTFDNFPRARKCTMCMSLRWGRDKSGLNESYGRTSPEILPAGGNVGKCTVSHQVWLQACRAAVEGECGPLVTFLTRNGRVSRAISSDDVAFLNKPTIFQKGHTLADLVLMHAPPRRQAECLQLLLPEDIQVVKTNHYRFDEASPGNAEALRAQVGAALRSAPVGDEETFSCPHVEEETFALTLASGVRDLGQKTRKQLFRELVHESARQELELKGALNWGIKHCTLLPVWNRCSGDSLTDGVLQSAYGICDTDGALRWALARALNEPSGSFFRLWVVQAKKELVAEGIDLLDRQLLVEWTQILSSAAQPGCSLGKIHIFVLAHILRRPIIVYSVWDAKDRSGGFVGNCSFQGVYLPILWERNFCWRTPIFLGHASDLFFALLISPDHSSRRKEQSPISVQVPLTDSDGRILPLHYVGAVQPDHELLLMHSWLTCCISEQGFLMAEVRLKPPSSLVQRMFNDWLLRYQRLSHTTNCHVKSPRKKDHPPKSLCQASASSILSDVFNSAHSHNVSTDIDLTHQSLVSKGEESLVPKLTNSCVRDPYATNERIYYGNFSEVDTISARRVISVDDGRDDHRQDSVSGDFQEQDD